jgi:hypothetical protein
MAAWDEYGPAEFDRRRMPRGHKSPPAAQAGLFVAAVTPKPARAAPADELPGQLDMLTDAGDQ